MRRVVAACADTLFPPNGRIPVSGTQAGLVRYTYKFLRRLSWLRRWLTLLAFHFIQWSPFVVGPRRACFTLLRPEERLQTLTRLSVSRIPLFRMAYMWMRAIMTMGYLLSPKVEAHVMRRTAPIDTDTSQKVEDKDVPAP